MVTWVLDASAVLRLLDNEAGADRVAEILTQHLDGSANAVISALHWGEITGIFLKRHGVQAAGAYISKLEALQLIVVPATAKRAERSAAIKVRHRIPYVDAFAVELAGQTGTALLTADFDFQPAEPDIQIEFLPVKSKA